MCGIVLVGGADAGEMAVAGLKRLQYRGYDSYGFAWTSSGRLGRLRSTDPLEEMVAHLPAADVVIGHTRWATHGHVSTDNAHPHVSQDGSIALVHNGIVENVAGLRKDVETDLQGSTDSEVVLRLLEMQVAVGDSVEIALMDVFGRLEGRNAIVLLLSDGRVIGIKRGSPLVAGRSGTHCFLGSDVLSFSPWASEHQLVEDNCLFGFMPSQVPGEMRPIGLDQCWQPTACLTEAIEKEGHPHFMVKEILEQWQTIPRQFHLAQPEFAQFIAILRNCHRLIIVGAGGAAITAGHIAHTLRQQAGLDALDVPAYEVESYLAPFDDADTVGTVLLAISQSGETADTLAAVELAQGKGMTIASLVNMPHTTLASQSTFTFGNGSGPEICVLSTKSASAQIAFGVRVAAALKGMENQWLSPGYCSRLSQFLDTETLAAIHQVAESLVRVSSLFVLGHGGHYWSARMAALNIKEASYIHAEAFATGELKHGVIAMIEAGTPVLVFDDGVMTDNAIAEVQARGAMVIAVTDRKIDGVQHYLPRIHSATLVDAASSIIPTQILAYQLGVLRGVNPDRPRNLAKSVTVR